MKEISFKELFDNLSNPPEGVNIDNIYLHYLLAIYAIENLKIIRPDIVDDKVGYMYAINHNELLSKAAEKGWSSYSSIMNKEISIDTTYNAVALIDKLIEPFKNSNDKTKSKLFTIPLPPEIERVILNEDLTNPNVMITLELSVKNLVLANNKCVYHRDRFERAFSRLTFGKVIDCFDGFLKKCVDRYLSDNSILKLYNSTRLHHIAIGLSCLYRLFYIYQNTYWEVFDDILANHCWILSNEAIKTATNLPAVTPETAVGIVSPKTYIEPKLYKNRSSHLSVAERYLILLYHHANTQLY